MSEPGAYWARREGEPWRIVEVVRSSLGDGRLFVHLPGTNYVFSPSEFVAWAGPLDPPPDDSANAGEIVRGDG